MDLYLRETELRNFIFLSVSHINHTVEDGFVVKDVHGQILSDVDSVFVIKDLPVKGASKKIKVGTKAPNIRLVEGDHSIDCKVPGFGAMGLKSKFVKKA